MSYDKYQFGNSQAAINLADILGQMEHGVSRKVSRAIHQYQAVFLKVSKIEDREFRLFVLFRTWEWVKSVVSNFDIDEKVKTHTLNVLMVYYKKILRGEPLNRIQRNELGKKKLS